MSVHPLAPAPTGTPPLYYITCCGDLRIPVYASYPSQCSNCLAIFAVEGFKTGDYNPLPRYVYAPTYRNDRYAAPDPTVTDRQGDPVKPQQPTSTPEDRDTLARSIEGFIGNYRSCNLNPTIDPAMAELWLSGAIIEIAKLAGKSGCSDFLRATAALYAE